MGHSNHCNHSRRSQRTGNTVQNSTTSKEPASVTIESVLETQKQMIELLKETKQEPITLESLARQKLMIEGLEIELKKTSGQANELPCTCLTNNRIFSNELSKLHFKWDFFRLKIVYACTKCGKIQSIINELYTDEVHKALRQEEDSDSHI
jgi:hypothetical protein